MRRITSVLSILAASVILSASPLLAAEINLENEATKDECLLVSMNCVDNVDSIQQRIERLNREIAKGADVYTRDELKILNNKLEEAVRLLDVLTSS